MAAASHVVIGIVVWGDAFTRLMLDYALPSLLAPGNLSALAADRTVEILLLTTGRDRRMVEDAPIYHAIPPRIAVKFLEFAPEPIPLDPPERKFALMNILHQQMVNYARLRDAGIVMLTPDIVIAEGAFTRLAASIASGKRVFMSHAPSVDLTKFAPLLDAWHATSGSEGEVIAVPPRPLMTMATRSWHPVTLCYMHDSTTFNRFTSFMYWRLGEHGLLCRAFHLGPVYFYPQNWAPELLADHSRTIDQVYIGEACPDPESYDFCADSDEFLYLELSPPEKRYPVPKFSLANAIDIAMFAVTQLQPMNMRFFAHKLWLHDGVARADYAPVERQSDAFVEDVFRKVRQLEASRRQP
jgi:hypothetical protein